MQAVKIVRIVADRFGAASDGSAIDLATGAAVMLKIGTDGGAAEQTRWSLRCDALQKMHHPRLAALIDYGPLGESQRFEAWQCAASQRSAPEEADCAIHTIERRADAVVADLFASLDGSRPHIISIWGPPSADFANCLKILSLHR